jgi:hypothetical protein
MKRTCAFSAMVSLFGWSAVAQDGVTTQKFQATLSSLSDVENSLRQAKVMAIGAAVMGPAVKNAPYSAVEVTESTQMLADGNRIHQETQVPVYRDSEGRVRRENSPDQVMIWDPVANVSYMLNPKTQTARKMPLGMNVAYAFADGGVGGGGKVVTFAAGGGGKPVAFDAGPGMPLPPLPGGPATRVITREFGMQTFLGKIPPIAPKSESLGKQTIEGVAAEGTRLTSTIEAGVIGNDRPIDSVSENWYSPDLQTLVKSTHTDPRTGEETFQLVNITRVEPPSTLFQVPPEFRMVYGKMPGGLDSFSPPPRQVSGPAPQE